MSEGCEVTTATGGNVRLAGTVEFGNFSEVRGAVERILDEQPALTVDLSGLAEANSVTVALLLAWFRAASRQDKSVVFVDAPRDLRNIIEFSGLSEVLPMGSDSGGAPARAGVSTAVS